MELSRAKGRRAVTDDELVETLGFELLQAAYERDRTHIETGQPGQFIEMGRFLPGSVSTLAALGEPFALMAFELRDLIEEAAQSTARVGAQIYANELLRGMNSTEGQICP